jgi:hypothetical protein
MFHSDHELAPPDVVPQRTITRVSPPLRGGHTIMTCAPHVDEPPGKASTPGKPAVPEATMLRALVKSPAIPHLRWHSAGEAGASRRHQPNGPRRRRYRGAAPQTPSPPHHRASHPRSPTGSASKARRTVRAVHKCDQARGPPTECWRTREPVRDAAVPGWARVRSAAQVAKESLVRSARKVGRTVRAVGVGVARGALAAHGMSADPRATA